MSILTEQEITDIANNDALWDDGKHLGEATLNEYRYARAIEAKVIEKIKAQGPVVWMAPSGSAVLNEDVGYTPNWTDYYTVPLYRLPEGD